MKKIVFLLASMVLLSACTVKPSQSSEIIEQNENIVLNVFNWGEYMDTSLNEEFEKETGIKVNYRTFQTNEMLYSTLKSGGSSYDVIIPSDYMIGRLIEEDMLEPINLENIPNYSDIDEQFLNTEYDKQNKFSVPYMWGTVGLIYDKNVLGDSVDSWSALFDNQNSSNILMFDNPRDAFAIALQYGGKSINSTDENDLNDAFTLLQEQKPLVQAYVMDQIFEKMISGEAVVGPYYAGDAITMISENPNLDFVIPKEGSNLFIDAFCIPKGSKNKTAAEQYINFMCKTTSGRANSDEIGYSTPLKSVKAELEQEGFVNTIAYPDKDTLSRCSVFINLPKETREIYDTLWAELMIAN